MPKKLTQIEAEQKSSNLGVKLVGQYINSYTKTKFLCPKCNRIFNTRPSHIWSSKTKTCSHCHIPNIGFKNNKLTIIDIIYGKYTKIIIKAICECGKIWEGKPSEFLKYKTCSKCNKIKIGDKIKNFTIIKIITNSRVEAKCKCGNIWTGEISNIRIGTTKSCGKCTIPKIGDIFGKLTVIEVYPSKSHGGKVDAICICGNIWHGKIAHLLSGNTKSCGCSTKEFQRGLRNDLSGKTFGDIEVIKFSHYSTDKNKNRKPWYLCKCICGNYSVISGSNIKHQNRCGKCRKKRNGQTVSQKQLNLYKLLNNKGIINYKIYLSSHPSYIDIAFVLNKNKIAVEYDEWVWHGSKQKRDLYRMNKLIRKNWKVLRIKAHNNLPKQEELDKAIYELAYTNRKQYTITLNGWGKGKTRV